MQNQAFYSSEVRGVPLHLAINYWSHHVVTVVFNKLDVYIWFDKKLHFDKCSLWKQWALVQKEVSKLKSSCPKEHLIAALKDKIGQVQPRF